MKENIPDALIDAFERHYDTSWNDPALRNERLAWRAAWASKPDAAPSDQTERIAELQAQLEAIGAGGVEPLRKAAPDTATLDLTCKSTQKRLAAQWGFVPASELDILRDDAECFRFWVSEAARSPSATAQLIMHCTTEQDYRDAILPIVRKAQEITQAQRIPVLQYDPRDVAFPAAGVPAAAPDAELDQETIDDLAADHGLDFMAYTPFARAIEAAIAAQAKEG